MTRQELQQLADERAADGAALLLAGRYSAAYYLLGYAVECALKACVAKQTKAEEFPDRDRAVKAWTHNFKNLIDVAGLKEVFEEKLKNDKAFKDNWKVLAEWNEGTRYTVSRPESDVVVLQTAIFDPTTGIMPWIRSYW